MNSKTTAKDFFMHVAVIVLLYAGVVALLNILFSVINVAFPQVNQSFYYSPSISFPVATLIVVFPLFVYFSNLIRKSYVQDPSKKEYAVRKWLLYITLFIAGGVLAGDLITLIYFFLDGQELTTGFLLKVLSVLVVAGSVLGYFVDDLKDNLTKSRRNIWRLIAIVLVLGSIILGFVVLGTPQSQRQARYDNQRISDLQNIQWQIVNYWQQKERLPDRIGDLEDSISGFVLPSDPETDAPYEYIKTGNLNFELCAEFNRDSEEIKFGQPRIAHPEFGGKLDENWQHSAGRVCFERDIDPELHSIERVEVIKR
jgi:hypothetical protein